MEGREPVCYEQATPEQREAYRHLAKSLLNQAIGYLVSISNEWAEDGYQEAIDFVAKSRDDDRKWDDGSGKAFRDLAWTDEERRINDEEFAKSQGGRT